MTTTTSSYVLFSDGVEEIESGEQETIDKIIQAMEKGGQLTRKDYGKSVRTSHAKAHGLLRGELQVLEGLPDFLGQGLFATARSYGVIARLSHLPGALDDDRRVSAPRGFSFKVLGVEGPKLPVHEGELTQDFVLDTGKVFNALGTKTFLAQLAPVETTAPRLPEVVKGAVSAVSRVTNEALNAVGANSATLDFFGHPFLHPLGEAYFSQVPIRYGDYIAKLSVTPVSPALTALKEQKFDPRDYDGLRTAVTEFFQRNPAEFEVAIQLCTDLDRMPVENANKEWPEDESPYQPVAHMTFPVQDAYSPARQSFVEDGLSFCPAHSLAAHRPLGSIMRARIQAYEVLGKLRREQNGSPVREPRSIDEMPD
ncbi:MAG: catalase family protein [Acidobacteriota bacterium]|nr:catalase family protein [Acidobacteriota bacterium]